MNTKKSKVKKILISLLILYSFILVIGIIKIPKLQEVENNKGINPEIILEELEKEYSNGDFFRESYEKKGNLGDYEVEILDFGLEHYDYNNKGKITELIYFATIRFVNNSIY